ncbi:peptide/nickel transport system ATP-binding protein [Plantibacter flavus]|jgi:peptide/nickel transport system ATP-binding protein|uniref:Peptide/nickel transport system ATP-binding protein n=1 Tax=Plantibacter flavus TaxID=150123 RepID=A0A3N2C3H8_9MICO|nr:MULTISPECIES: ABC transporter ATP-binding protein [Plantibacter]ROR82072.1 peptide/nickel transport system ATP-binding protein [Plantibacter flavus]SMG51172.1 peptide/nickel transport system ATP-binding protein [Plantibacter flavus]
MDRDVDALHVEGLSIAYGGAAPSVQDVSLRVGPGEIVGVIGESGSGKSSIALAMMGLLPDSATVTASRLDVAGTDMQGATERDWSGLRGARASMVFQEPMSALNPCMRIGAQIAEVLRIHGVADKRQARARALEILHLVRMPDAERRLGYYPHQLSGGQRQRVVIAIAVAAGPTLLVADEPTTALDVTVQAQILELLRTLRDETGMGVLFISHDLGVIGQLCERVAVMYRGRIVETGRAERVLADPQHPYTRALLESIPRPSVPVRSPLAVIPVDNDFAEAPAVLEEVR